MPDISEYRLGSACRINNSDQFSEKVDSEVSTADPFSSNTLKLGECTVPVQELQHVISEKPSSDDDGSSNNNPNMEEVTCCCHDGKNECGILNDSNSSSWLRRLFTSSLFNLDMTIQYLFKSEDVNVQMYLADRLFGFPESDVDFYLLQLVSLYEKSPSLAEHLTNYFIYRCTKSVSFAINLVWLLDTFSSHSYNPLKRVSSILHNRPSSVPIFSYVSNQLYLMNSNDHSQSINNSKSMKLKSSSSVITPLQELDYHHNNNIGDVNDNTIVTPTPITTTTELSNDNRFVYTAQTLRDLLLPIDETTWGSFIPQSIVNGSSNMGSYNNVNTHHTHNTSPLSNCKLSPNIHYNIGHKRSTSDVTSSRNYHYYVDKSRNRIVMDQLDLINNPETNQSIVTITSNQNRWSSSQDSAVCLSTVDVINDDVVNNPITTTSNVVTNQISLNSICPIINRSLLMNENRHSLHQLHLNNLDENPLKSSMSMNKIITKEILPQSCLPKHSLSSVNLKRLNSSLCIMNDDTSAQIKSSSSLNQTASVPGDNNNRNDVDRSLSSYSTNNITSDLMLGSLGGGVPVVTTITFTKTKSINEGRNNPTHTMESCSSTTESSSPFDSGLYMTAPNRCIHSSCDGVGVVDHGDEDDDNDNHDIKLQSPENSFHLPHCPHYHTTSSVMYRTLTLRNYLVPRIIPEWDFVDGLLRIARRLVPISPKEQRTAHLQAELANLNLHLPARVWLPVNKAGHIVLRIPPTAAVCLNSKDKAPFLIYVEILCCDDPSIISLPSRPLTAASSKSSNSLSAVYPWNSNLNTGCLSSAEMTENHEINVNTHTSDELSLRSSSISSNVSLSDELINPTEWNHHYHLTIDETNEGKDPTTKSTRNQYEVNETIIKDDSFTTTDSITVTNTTRSKSPIYIGAGEIRNRLKEQCELQPHRSFRCDPEDPSAAVLKEPWHVKCERIRATSPWGSLPGWILTSAIVKVGDDLRQEQLAYQLLTVLKNIWSMEYVPLWLRPLTVVVTSSDSGFIEPVPDTVSFHQIKRHAHLSLLDYMHREHGGDNSEEFLTAQRNFLHSCAAYCLVGYLFQVKDRHNGNILLDNQGHIIHIDYGFILSSSPGKNLGFETSPFKLTLEQVDVIGGLNSDLFEYFKFLLLRGLLAARKHMEQICVLVEIAHATCPQLPCFARGNGYRTITELRQRFQLSRTEEQLKQLVDQMVHNSLNSMTTKLYDSFQYYTNGIQ
uniref:Phosphatidylinositol 4-kinase beta n=1 Tax=Schistosoma mansoni TaxID=6183 RepID=A0A3Q0KLQ7_SCHMA